MKPIGQRRERAKALKGTGSVYVRFLSALNVQPTLAARFASYVVHALGVVVLLSACSSARLLPGGGALLSNVKLKVEGSEVKTSQLRALVRQEPNAKWFGLTKAPLGFWVMAGQDTTRRMTRFLRRLGEPPVVYDPTVTRESCQQMALSLRSRGWNSARVWAEEQKHRHKVSLTYHVLPGMRSYVSSLRYEADGTSEADSVLRLLLYAGQLPAGALPSDNTPVAAPGRWPTPSSKSLLYRGMPLDVSLLDQERSRLVSELHEQGYYRVNKEFITYRADTLGGDFDVALTLRFATPKGVDPRSALAVYRIGTVDLWEDVRPNAKHREQNTQEGETDSIANQPSFRSGRTETATPAPVSTENSLVPATPTQSDTMSPAQTHLFPASEQGDDRAPGFTAYRGIRMHYLDRMHLLRRTYSARIALRPDSIYRERNLHNTYRNLGALEAISFSTVRFHQRSDTSNLLDCDIQVVRAKPHTLSMEVEGTNTSGDFGAALSLGYATSNLLRGGESLSLRLRGAWEAITGLEGYSNENYIEYGAEATLRLPTMLLPLMKRERKARMKALTQLTLSFNSQERPEFHRRVLSGLWGYRWTSPANPRWSHRLDALSLNYVFMPWVSDTFRRDYLEGDDPHYAVLRYTYENLLIMRWAWQLTYNSLAGRGGGQSEAHSGGYQVKLGVETAGNFLYACSKLFHARRHDPGGQYNFLSTAYSQYVKVDIDWTKSLALGEHNSLAMHAAIGLALPYGNSNIVPYEKRYFSGGASSVRGWSVRELGPGSYSPRDGRVNFINQTGNLRLDMSVEYRTRLFWKFSGAAFIDAGNVWRVREPAGETGGAFRLHAFPRELAAAYGLGLRLNFDYFVLRLDGGMKAINPAHSSGSGHWPIVHPNFGRDFTLHFAVGLPF